MALDPSEESEDYIRGWNDAIATLQDMLQEVSIGFEAEQLVRDLEILLEDEVDDGFEG